MSITLIRHGQTEWNRIGRVQGRTDIPLNDQGRNQARELGLWLADLNEKWSLITSSPLSRARETARIVADHLGEELAPPVELLREQDYGEAEGVTVAEFNERWPGRDFKHGETSSQLADRAFAALSHLESQAPQGRILAVSHGALIRRLVSELANVPYRDVPAIKNSAMTTFERDSDNGWAVTEVNNEPAAALFARP